MDNNTAFDREALEEKLNDPTASPIPLPLEFLKDITCNFSEEQELGRGGYGVVYKGVLQSGKIIAVKKLFQNLVKNEDQFQKEVTNLIEIKHQNIVRLVGYCAEPSHELIKLPNGAYAMAQIPRSLLCFEYLGNMSLDKHLSDESCGLDWNKRYEIIIGICSGLHFLHGECNIVHLDLKPENILLDCAMMQKIADFGLSKLLGAQKSRTIVSGNLPGTLGYMAPEYRMQGLVSPKADIFSFGVIIIEIITGVKEYPLCAVQSFHEVGENGNMQSNTKLKEYRENVIGRWRDVFKKEPKYTSPEIYNEQVEQCIRTALECLKYDSTTRPTACDISEMLTGEICSCQKNTLLSAQPFELRFHFTKHHEVASCPLQLTNNISDLVAFRMIVTKDLEKYFVGPVHGLVLPRKKYNLRVALHRPLEDDNTFTIKLESTIIDEHDQLLDIQTSGSEVYSRLFTEAKKKGREVQQVKVKLLFIVEHEQGNITSRHLASAVCNLFLHPKKNWIITTDWNNKLNIFDYQEQKTVDSSEFLPLDLDIHLAIFIPRKQWFVVGYSCHIKVYSYKTMKEVKNFDAHDGRVSTFDIHPSKSYVLSASYSDRTVKLWNWEKDWECIWKYEMRAGLAKFNPKDADYIACATPEDVKVLNISSPINTFSIESSKVSSLEYLTRGDKLYLITGHYDGLVMIWDWENRSCLKTLNEHTETVSTVCAHPDLPIIITGSWDGTICLWNSFTFTNCSCRTFCSSSCSNLHLICKA